MASTRQQEHSRPHEWVDERTARRTAESARESRWHRPSFGKELFLGRFRLDLLSPRTERQTSDHGEEFLRRLREFCASQVDGVAIERTGIIPDEVIRGLKELGALGMKIGAEYGGLGLSQAYYNRALMIVGSVHPALGALLSAHQSIGVAQPVSLFGSPWQRSEFLPRCARTDISAFLLTEPDVGSDPARLATRATPAEHGGYFLDGVKLWTTNGVIADLLVVLAKVPASHGHSGGITAFVVEADSPGITVENRNAFMGLRGIENGVTRFDQVWVPEKNRIGAEGAGLKIALTTLNTGRLSLPALCVGTAKWCVKIAREWSGARVQWGRPIGQHEAVSGKISFIAATAFGMESMLETASEMADAGMRDVRIEAALTKLYGSEMGWLISDELVQIRGGRGFEKAESLAARGERGIPAEQVLRDMRINRIFEGSTEIMHLLIAREAVDTHLSVAGGLIDPDMAWRRKAVAAVRAGRFYFGWFPRLVVGAVQRPRGLTEFGSLAKHLRYVERASRRLARHTFYGMVRWRGSMERRQRFLARLVDIAAELFAMSASCLRARRMFQDNSDQAASAHALAAAFCAQARARVDELFRRLWTNADHVDRSLAREVLDERHVWLEAGILDPSIEGPLIAHTPTSSSRQNVRRKVAN